jgi:ParB-like chromosome segregation protein Spo0J
MPAKKSMDLMARALDELTAEVERNPDPLKFPLNSARIDFLPADLIRPDPVQARRVLPDSLHFAFHAQEMTPAQALQELIRVAQLAARQNNRPFTNVAELLVDNSSEEKGEAETIKYSPEETLVRDLVILATTIRDDGQVNPLTVVDVSQGVSRLFRIETGERRYWASWLAREFLPGYKGDGTIPCVIVQNSEASVFRQARENTSRAGLSAIAMARQTALLLLAVHGISKPEYAVNNDFFRQALSLDLHDKKDYTDAILMALGGISRSFLSRYKSLLALSDEAMELSDRYDISEGHLRWVLNLPLEDQAEMVRQIVQFNLTGNQIRDMCSATEPKDEADDDLTSIDKSAVRFAKLIRAPEKVTVAGLVAALLKQEKDMNIAKARLKSFKDWLDHVEAELNK